MQRKKKFLTFRKEANDFSQNGYIVGYLGEKIMEYQDDELEWMMLQPKKQSMRIEAKEFEKRYLEIKAQVERLNIPVNIKAICRIIANEHSCSVSKVRRLLLNNNVIHSVYAKRTTKKDSTERTVPSSDGSTIDGNSEMHAV